MPYIRNRYARRVDAQSIALMNPANTEILRAKPNEVQIGSYASNAQALRMLTTADKICKIEMRETGATTGATIQYEGQTSNELQFLMHDGGAGVVCIAFERTGGLMKYGTKTGTGDVAVDGYVSIKDSAGAGVKLATVA